MIGDVFGASPGVLGQGLHSTHQAHMAQYRASQASSAAIAQLLSGQQQAMIRQSALNAFQNCHISYDYGLALQNYRRSDYTFEEPAYDRQKQKARRTGWRLWWRRAAVFTARASGEWGAMPMTLSEARLFNVAAAVVFAASLAAVVINIAS